MTPTFLAWGMLVLVTDWVEMKSSWFSQLSLSRKGRSRRGEIRTQKKKKKKLKDCCLACFLFISDLLFFPVSCVCISFATFYVSYSKWVSGVTFCEILFKFSFLKSIEKL